VVVPVGQEVLGSHTRQGYITRRVAFYLNLTAVIALLPLAWDMVASGETDVRRRRLRWAAWAAMLLAQGLLFWMYPQLNELLHPLEPRVLDRQTFTTLHRWYLWTVTAQWACGVLYIWLMLRAWSREERTVRNEVAGSPGVGG
jgi:hypothetical protein